MLGLRHRRIYYLWNDLFGRLIETQNPMFYVGLLQEKVDPALIPVCLGMVLRLC